MSCTLSSTIEAIEMPLWSQEIPATSEAAYKRYETAPMVAVAPVPATRVSPTTDKLSEEELHSSFEEALEERINSGEMRRISALLEELPSSRPLPHTGPLAPRQMVPSELQKLLSTLGMLSAKTYALLIGFGLLCVLLGFDLLGLLLLTTR